MICGPIRNSPGEPVEKIIVTGGWRGNGGTGVKEIYTIATDRWETGSVTNYRVTIQVVSNLPLTSKQKFRFSMRPKS